MISISETVHGSANCANGLSKGDVDALDEFNTEVVLKPGEAAPIPDTASFIQKMEREREARDNGEVKDNRGFLAKYVSGLLGLERNLRTNLIFFSLFSGCTLSL